MRQKFFHFSVAAISYIVLECSGVQLKGKKMHHFDKTPMQYRPTAVYCNTLQFFHDCKNDNFQMKKCGSFLNFAQNIGRGYTLEPHHCSSDSNEYPQSMF